jgi:hypothetical protein
MYGTGQAYGSGGWQEGMSGGGINIYFTGTMAPTPEQMQALIMQITSAVGVAG